MTAFVNQLALSPRPFPHPRPTSSSSSASSFFGARSLATPLRRISAVRLPHSSTSSSPRPPSATPGLRASAASNSDSDSIRDATTDANAELPVRAAYAVADGDNLELRRTPPRRIALVVEPSPFTHTSGYSNRFKNLLLQLRDAGDDVLVIVPDNAPDAPTEFAGARILSVPGFRFPLYRRITLSLGLRGVYPALKAFDPDVIHLTTPGFLIFAMLLFARLLCKPLLLSYHTHLPIYTRDYGLGLLEGVTWAMLRLQHNRADFTLTTSPQLCDELVRNGIERVGLWRKGIDTAIFNPRFKDAGMRARLTDGHPEDPLLIYVGRIGAEKNLSFFKGLLGRFPRARLALVGDGPYKTTLERELAGSTRTHFAGLLHGDELSRAFASADVFVMPSESETLGFVVLESMASGVPVVGARAGGIPDIIDHGKTSFLFTPGCTDDCARLVGVLLDDEDRRAEMGRRAREEALRWSWKASAAATRNFAYGRAISNFRFRAMGGLGLPRSLTWLRWLRLRIAMVLVRLFGRKQLKF